MHYQIRNKQLKDMKENHLRSIIKGITWRIVGTLDTMMLSYLFTGSIGDAAKIAGTEVITKVFLFYLHERTWMRLSFWRRKSVLIDGTIEIIDHHKRSLFKGISWRVVGTLDTIIIATFWTGDYSKALKIGFAEVFTKILLYYGHERLWLKVPFGRSVIKTYETKEDDKLQELEGTVLNKEELQTVELQ